jgi:putative SOS response-associated peptidase YedK
VWAFAGLWERWEGPEGSVESCAIPTTEANQLVRPYPADAMRAYPVGSLVNNPPNDGLECLAPV